MLRGADDVQGPGAIVNLRHVECVEPWSRARPGSGSSCPVKLPFAAPALTRSPLPLLFPTVPGRSCILLTLLTAAATPVALAQPEVPTVADRSAAFVATTPEFRFHSDFWLNLHDYLYGIAGGGPDERGGFEPENADCIGTLPVDEVAGWRTAEAYYRERLGARHHRRDPLMQAIRHTLAGLAAESASDPELDEVLAILRGAAPAYRRCLWDLHDARNRDRIAELVGFLNRYGRDLPAELSRLYREPWPATTTVDVVSYSDFAGANTSSKAHTMISSVNASTAGFSGLELVLHEASHLMFGPSLGTLAEALATASAALGIEPPDQLWHALSFYTSGELVARVARSAGDPGFEPYAKRQGLFGTAFRGYLEPIERHWEPYLDGEADLSAAMAALVAAIPVEGE